MSDAVGGTYPGIIAITLERQMKRNRVPIKGT
jgi:hypothetical protein